MSTHPTGMQSLGFGVLGLGFRVVRLWGFRVLGLGYVRTFSLKGAIYEMRVYILFSPWLLKSPGEDSELLDGPLLALRRECSEMVWASSLYQSFSTRYLESSGALNPKP